MSETGNIILVISETTLVFEIIGFLCQKPVVLSFPNSHLVECLITGVFVITLEYLLAKVFNRTMPIKGSVQYLLRYLKTVSYKEIPYFPDQIMDLLRWVL